MPGLSEHLLAEGFAPGLIEEAKAAGPDLVRGLWSLKEIDEARLLEGLSRFFDLPVAWRLEEDLGPDQLSQVPLAYFKTQRACPLKLEEETLTLALADPQNLPLLNDLKVIFGVPRLKVYLAPPREIAAAINRLYARQSSDTGQAIEEIDEELASLSLSDLDEGEDLMDATSDAPVVKLVNLLLVEAVKRRSSDIHIEPYRDTLNVRYRINGLLYDILTPPRQLAPAISSRIKVMADLDIAERRLPQDGRFRIKVADQEIDVRVSVVPTAFGERTVLRLLNKTQSLFTLPELG
ncbi:MAG: Flp pilus assembly complex ATPase component TadA, partial [Deltaproteobacteria bacterium]|nr:Flp pilus assembly complex ATPase component TadA [Deltaproteobacteria bacterium]